MLFTVLFYLRIFIENYSRLWFKKSAKQENLSLFMNYILWNEKMRVWKTRQIIEFLSLLKLFLPAFAAATWGARRGDSTVCTRTVHTVCVVLTINVPVVYMAWYVMVLRRATSLRGALEGVGPENQDFFGPWNGNELFGPKKVYAYLQLFPLNRSCFWPWTNQWWSAKILLWNCSSVTRKYY